jgi:hypothetical protein
LQVVPLLQLKLQHAKLHSVESSTVPPVGTHDTHAPWAVLHTSEPASSIARQSPSMLHCTHFPAMLVLVVSPHTWFGGLPSAVQLKPVGWGVKVGISEPEGPELVQAGFVSQTVVAVGMSVGSSMDVVLPEPSHTIFWQLPGT